jgi:hypothetical protein
VISPTRDGRRERVVIDLAVAILRGGMTEANTGKVDTLAVRLALRCLLPYCPQKWPLTAYWEGAGGDHDIGRAQAVTAAYNGIIRQLRASGVWRD